MLKIEQSMIQREGYCAPYEVFNSQKAHLDNYLAVMRQN